MGENRGFFYNGDACPQCGNNGTKVIYAGIPQRLCPDEQCGMLWGPLSWILGYELIPFNGQFFSYSGSYRRALWAYLRGEG